MSPAEPNDSVARRQRLAAAGVQPGEETRFVARLLAGRHLPPTELASFVAAARQANRSLQEHAVSAGLIDEFGLVEITAAMYKTEAVRLDAVRIEQDIAELIDIEQARGWKVLPYSRTDEGYVLAAIDNPGNVTAADNLPKVLSTRGLPARVEWRLASSSDLAAHIDAVYRSNVLTDTAPRRDAPMVQAESRMTVRGEAQAGGVVKLVDDLIYQALLDGASDIHVTPARGGAMVQFRVDGDLEERLNHIPPDRAQQIVARIKNLAGMRPDETRDSQDGRVTYQTHDKEVDLRIVTIPMVVPGWDRPERAVMRLLDPANALRSLADLGMSPDNLRRYTSAIKRSVGLALVTGPTGSGKSTTLYSSLASRRDPKRSIASLENPVEYQLDGIAQTPVGGQSKLTFASGLRAFMRGDPDTIMVGEIRDTATADAAIEAALTGHFIYSTLHTNDAIGAITRLRELGVAPFLLRSTLRVVVAQRLLKRLCPDCRVGVNADVATLRDWGAPAGEIQRAQTEGPLAVFEPHPGGCVRCKQRGYRGRVGVHEVLTFTDEMRALITNPDASTDDILAIARREGMHSLADDAFARVRSGDTSLEEFAEKAAT